MSGTAGHQEGVNPGLTLRIENEDSTGGSRERQRRERQVLVTFKPWRKPGLPHELPSSVVQWEPEHSMVFAGESHNSGLRAWRLVGTGPDWLILLRSVGASASLHPLAPFTD